MKLGDLVSIPSRDKAFGIKKVGVVFDEKIIRNRIPVLWFDGNTEVDYEPVNLLEVINES